MSKRINLNEDSISAHYLASHNTVLSLDNDIDTLVINTIEVAQSPVEMKKTFFAFDKKFNNKKHKFQNFQMRPPIYKRIEPPKKNKEVSIGLDRYYNISKPLLSSSKGSKWSSYKTLRKIWPTDQMPHMGPGYYADNTKNFDISNESKYDRMNSNFISNLPMHLTFKKELHQSNQVPGPGFYNPKSGNLLTNFKPNFLEISKINDHSQTAGETNNLKALDPGMYNIDNFKIERGSVKHPFNSTQKRFYEKFLNDQEEKNQLERKIRSLHNFKPQNHISPPLGMKGYVEYAKNMMNTRKNYNNSFGNKNHKKRIIRTLNGILNSLA